MGELVVLCIVGIILLWIGVGVGQHLSKVNAQLDEIRDLLARGRN